jgi:hypothetical protein
LYRTGKSYLMNRLAGQNHGEWHAVYQPKVWLSLSHFLNSYSQL